MSDSPSERISCDGSTDMTLLPNEDDGQVANHVPYDEKKSDSWSSDSENGNRGTKRMNISSRTLVVIINVANFVNGIYMAVPGPTLLFLAERVSSGVAQVSIILAGRSAGNLLGAFAASAISKRRMRYWDATMRLGISFIIYGVTTLAIPFVSTLWALIAVLSIGGFLFGFTNTGFLAMQLEIWGEKKSRPLMQLYQGTYSIGATLAPLFASPFLKMAANSQYSEPTLPSCLKGNLSEIEVFDNDTNNMTISTEDFTPINDINPATWVYVIIGGLHLLVAALMVIVSLCGVEDHARHGHKVVSEARAEEPLSRVAPLLLCVIAFYAFQVAAINVFASYIFSVSYCSKLELSITEASWLNFSYWLVFIFGRAIAFIIAARIRPSTLTTCCILMLVTSTVFMSTLGENNKMVVWISTVFCALAISPLFGSGVSWISRITNVSARYAVIFEIGAAIGAVVAFPVAGVLFDLEPYYVVHFVSGLIALLALSYAGMLLTGRRHTRMQSFGLKM